MPSQTTASEAIVTLRILNRAKYAAGPVAHSMALMKGAASVSTHASPVFRKRFRM